MNLSEIKVYPGQDPQVLNGNPQHGASGLKNISSQKIRDLTTAIQKIYHTELQRAPAILQQHAQKEIPIYLNPSMLEIAKVVLTGFQLNIVRANGKWSVQRTQLQPVKGMLFRSLNTSTIERANIAHECKHVIANIALPPCQNGCHEAFVFGLDNAQDSKKKSILLTFDQNIEASTGFATGEWSQIQHCRSSLEAMYQCAVLAFLDISEQSIWQILALLAEKSVRDNLFSTLEEVKNAISQVLENSTAMHVLKNPVFQPMKAGHHTVIVRRKNMAQPPLNPIQKEFSVMGIRAFGNIGSNGLNNLEFQCSEIQK